MNNNVILNKNCLRLLAKAAQTHPDDIIQILKIFCNKHPETRQQSGTFIHYTIEDILVNSDSSAR